MNENQVAAHIEALLFALGKPMSRQALTETLGVEAHLVDAALEVLRQAAPGRGIVVVDDGKILELRTAPEASELIERVRREENAREIGRAGLEVLAAILYRGPLTRSEIDFIRGVNSSQTLRTLTMRGLVRKIGNPKDERSFLYEATTELLSALGVTHPIDLPDQAATREKLTVLEAAYRSSQHGTDANTDL